MRKRNHKKSKNILFVIIVLLTIYVQGQERVITGKVTSQDDSLALPGANILVKGTTTGAVTDFDGNYSIKVPGDKAVLVFSYIGFVPIEETVDSRSKIDVSLATDATSLNEVVLIGYGSQRKGDLTGSVETLNEKTVADLPVASVDQKMVGQIAGAQVLQQTGAPGGGSSIRIRGNGSIGAGNEPLYVVDGHPYASSNNQTLNPLIFINPSNIESITVLKDASSTAIYGSRGANGVVLITTKTGRFNQNSISVNIKTGFQHVPEKGRPKMLNAKDFIYLQRDKIDIVVRQRENRDAINADYPEAYQNPENFSGEGTNWYDLMLRDALMTDYNINILKGNESTVLTFNLEYLKEEGTLKYTGLERLSSKLGIESKLGESVTLSASLQPTYIKQNRTDSGYSRSDVLGIALWANPTLSPYDGNGNLVPFLRSPANTYFTAWDFPNPSYVLQQTKMEQQTFRNLGMVDIEWKITPDLIFKSAFSTNWSYAEYFQYDPSTVGSPNKAPLAGTGSSNNARGTSFDLLNENTITYKKTIKDHRINAVLGYTWEKNSGNNITIDAYPFATDQIQTLNAAQDINEWGQSVEKWSLLSYLGRVNYTFKDRYLVTATVRSDGSSRFGEDNRFATFPSLALAWRAKEENFLSSVSSISDLKFRASYGKSGNFNIGNYAHLANIYAGNYVIDNTIVPATNVGLPNNSLTWEESVEGDIGVDLGLFGNRLNFTADYYNRRTSDMLLNKNIPAITGFNSQLVNIGSVKNEGLELSLGGKPIDGELRWDVNMNITFNKNKVLALNQDSDPIYSGNNDGRPTNITMVGKPIGQFFGFINEGIYSSADIADPEVPKYPSATVGAAKYRDINGDGQIVDILDYTVIGNPYPDFTFGINNSFAFKDFDLNIIMNGQYGGKVANGLRQTVDNLQGFFNVSEEWANRYRSESQPGDGIHSGVITNTPSLGHRFNTLWVEDATFLRISNISLGYNLPEDSFKSSDFLKSTRIYLTVQNLATFTKYSGGNPQGHSAGVSNVLSPGIDIASYPLPRTISLGLNLNF